MLRGPILLAAVVIPVGIGMELASAQDYPTRPVRIVEPFGAGGGVDVIARVFAQRLARLWRQPVSVENRPGNARTAAPALVAESPPDGYTLLVNTSAHAYSAAMVKNLPYDPVRDFIPIAPLTTQAYVLVAGRPAGVTTVAELIAAAKAEPGVLEFGSAGVGTGTHLAVEEFNLEAGITATHVPARPGDAIADVVGRIMAGRAYMMAPIPLALKDIRGGRLVAIGVSTKRRSALLPDVPTIAEGGVAGFDFPIWYGLWAPARTPADVVDRIAKDVATIVVEAEVRRGLAQYGAMPMVMSQAEFARFVLAEREHAARIMKAARP